jgi:hypothetical protein
VLGIYRNEILLKVVTQSQNEELYKAIILKVKRVEKYIFKVDFYVYILYIYIYIAYTRALRVVASFPFCLVYRDKRLCKFFLSNIRGIRLSYSGRTKLVFL